MRIETAKRDANKATAKKEREPPMDADGRSVTKKLSSADYADNADTSRLIGNLHRSGETTEHTEKSSMPFDSGDTYHIDLPDRATGRHRSVIRIHVSPRALRQDNSRIQVAKLDLILETLCQGATKQVDEAKRSAVDLGCAKHMGPP